MLKCEQLPGYDTTQCCHMCHLNADFYGEMFYTGGSNLAAGGFYVCHEAFKWAVQNLDWPMKIEKFDKEAE